MTWLNPTDPAAMRLRDFMAARGVWLASDNNYTQSSIMLTDYANEPRLDYSAQPSQYLFTAGASSVARGLAVAGRDYFMPYSGAISLQNWTSPTSTQVMMLGKSFYTDHDRPETASLRIWKVGPLLGWDDSGGAGGETDNPFTVGDGIYLSNASLRSGLTGDDPAVVRVAAWASGDRGPWDASYGDQNSRYAYVSYDVKDTYEMPPSLARRSFAHFKKPGTDEIVIDYVDVDASNLPAQTIRTTLQYKQNGQTTSEVAYNDSPAVWYNEGNTTCPGKAEATPGSFE
jgi:hypothetical protein